MLSEIVVPVPLVPEYTAAVLYRNQVVLLDQVATRLQRQESAKLATLLVCINQGFPIISIS